MYFWLGQGSRPPMVRGFRSMFWMKRAGECQWAKMATLGIILTQVNCFFIYCWNIATRNRRQIPTDAPHTYTETPPNHFYLVGDVFGHVSRVSQCASEEAVVAQERADEAGKGDVCHCGPV